MARTKIRSVSNSARSVQEVERSMKVQQIADRVFARHKGLLASLAEGAESLNETTSGRKTPAKPSIRKK